LWYFYNYAQDDVEEFERSRDFVEYHASFIEPQAVKKIRETRDKSQAAATVSDDNFENSVKNIFGREVVLGRPEGTSDATIQGSDPRQVVQGLE
jgi:hypothetical protein